MTINNKTFGIFIAALGAILVVIASFLNFYNFAVEDQSEKMTLEDISDYCEEISNEADVDPSTFNPHALLVIFAVIGITCALVTVLFPKMNMLMCVITIAAGIALLITVFVYAKDGALGDLKSYTDKTIDYINDLAAYFGYDGEFESTSKFAEGYYMTIAGSIVMIVGAGYSLISDYLSPD